MFAEMITKKTKRIALRPQCRDFFLIHNDNGEIDFWISEEARSLINRQNGRYCLGTRKEATQYLEDILNNPNLVEQT